MWTVTKAVVNALSTLAQREDIGATPVVAALSGRRVLSRSINVPIINENKVHRMVELEARQQIVISKTFAGVITCPPALMVSVTTWPCLRLAKCR